MLLLLLVGVTVPLLLLLDCVVLDGTTETIRTSSTVGG